MWHYMRHVQGRVVEDTTCNCRQLPEHRNGAYVGMQFTALAALGSLLHAGHVGTISIVVEDNTWQYAKPYVRLNGDQLTVDLLQDEAPYGGNIECKLDVYTTARKTSNCNAQWSP